jgi:HEAT repeat protein
MSNSTKGLGRLTSVISILVFWNSSVAGEPSNLSGEAESPVSRQRLKGILEKLASDDSSLYRAAEELVFLPKLDQHQSKEVFEGILNAGHEKPLFASSARFIHGMASCGPTQVDNLLVTIRKGEASEDEQLACLAALARMGSLAKRASPVLTDRLDDKKLAPRLRTALMITLESIGEGSSSIRKQIGQSLKENNCPLEMLVWSGSVRWMTESMIEDLTERVELPKGEKRSVAYDGLIGPTVVLGLLAEQSKMATRKLEAILKQAVDDDDTFCVHVALCLSRIEPKKAESYIRSSLKKHCVYDNLGHAKIGFITEYCYLLVDQHTTDLLVKMLEDPDLQVSRGAAFLLIAAGSSARSGFAEVLKRFRNASSAEKRQEYEYILRNIGNDSHLPSLKGDAAKESNQEVRGGLNRIINAIEKLEDKGEAYMRYVK